MGRRARRFEHLAMMSVVAPTGSALVAAVRTIVDPAGAINGTFSHAETSERKGGGSEHREQTDWACYHEAS